MIFDPRLEIGGDFCVRSLNNKNALEVVEI